MERLRNKVAIVTGSSRGIGRAIAFAIAKEGARVVVVSRTKVDIEKMAKEISAFGGQALPLVADVTNKGQVEHPLC